MVENFVSQSFVEIKNINNSTFKDNQVQEVQCE